MTNPGLESLMQVDHLIASNLHNILQLESDNHTHIHLYQAGTLWVAFDRSAYQLEQSTPYLEPPMVVELRNNPFPLVFNVIPDTLAHKLLKNGSPTRQTHQHLQLTTTPIDHHAFNTWYRQLVNG